MKDYKKLSKITFDEQASYYDVDNTAPVSKFPKICYPIVIEELKSAKFDSLLDLGCGTGALTKIIATEFPERKLAGLDLSDKMIAQAKAKNIPNCEFIVGDGEKLPYTDNSFDALICVLSIHHHPNSDQTLAEMYRVLKPNGTLIICEMDPPAIMRFIYNAFLLKILNTGDVHIFNKKELSQDIEKAGFHQVESRSIHRYMSIFRALKPV